MVVLGAGLFLGAVVCSEQAAVCLVSGMEPLKMVVVGAGLFLGAVVVYYEQTAVRLYSEQQSC